MWLLGLVAYWRWIVIGALVAALGVQTIRLQAEQERYGYLVREIEGVSREAIAHVEAVNAYQALINEELEHDIQAERKARALERKVAADRFAGLYGKYFGLLYADAGGGRLSETAAGAAEPVRDERVCFDADGLRASLERLHGELESRSGEVTALWGRWARLSGACSAP